MTITRLPFVGSGRLQEGGALAVRKQDFNAHVQGNGFRHDATHVDMNPPIPFIDEETVQATLEKMKDLIVSSGTGFLSIGDVDGYIQGDYNVGTELTPTLYDSFNSAFADSRLSNGGVILLLSGKYKLHNSVTVPPGISIIGEVGGSVIIGETGESSLFVIPRSNTTKKISTSLDLDNGSNLDVVYFANIVLTDNLDGYVLFGEPTMETTAMLKAEIGSTVVCDNVSFIGRVHSGSAPRSKTKSSIEYYGSGSSNTYLRMTNCYFDGLRNGIIFNTGNASNDLLVVNNCKARIFGTEDTSSQTRSLNTFIETIFCNLIVTNNYVNGYGSYVNTLVNISSGNGLNSKCVVTGNAGRPNSLIDGRIVDNSSATVSSFPFVVSNNSWGSNISETREVSWMFGDKGVTVGTSTDFLIYGTPATTSEIYGYSLNQDSLFCSYKDTGNVNSFHWVIPFFEIIPPNVDVVTVNYSIGASAVPSTFTSIVTLEGTNGTSTFTDTISSTTFSRTITPVIKYSTIALDKPYMYIKVTIDNGTAVDFSISQVNVTYTFR